MSHYITDRAELPHGLWLSILIPWNDQSCPEDRADVVDDVAEELADLLDATAEDDLLIDALRRKAAA